MLSFNSCKYGALLHSPRIEVGNMMYYLETTAESPLSDAQKHYADFKKLDDKSTQNLRHVLGEGKHYVWIRIEFEIPPEFRNQSLSMVIPHLKFAERLYCNNMLISQQGNFPPNEMSTLFQAHFFSFPRGVLRQEGINTIYIKIFALGKAGISSHSFIQPVNFGFANYDAINFHHTRIYMLLVGILFFTFLLYMSFYLNLPTFKEFRDFAIVNICTSIFIIPFFATELPMYTNNDIPFLPFIKSTLCIQPYFIIYFAALFAMDFQQIKFSPQIELIRRLILAFQVIVTACMPTFEGLVKIAPLMLTLLLVQGCFAAFYVIRNFLHKKTRRLAVQFSLGFLPLALTVTLDLILRAYDNTQTYPYFSIFGWVFAIATFILILSTKFAHIYRKSEQLSDHLQEEVDIRTRDLQGANYELSILNERLEKEKFRADLDLQMASIVQQRFFPQPNKRFRGWELSIYYNQQAIVSGDLYDYYAEKGILNGLSLFDVSGHGLSAGLVTMLSKNIIGHAFQKGFSEKEPIDKILTRINNIILYEKGEIDNYLTGLLCRFEEDEKSGNIKVELGNAGHPYPLKYSAQDNQIYEITGNDGKQHYGAIGMEGIEISFAKSDFVMAEGDILVCYTDGLKEASNAQYEQFGLENIKRIIKANSEKSANEMLDLLTKQLFAFIGKKPLEDDITIIIAKRISSVDFVPEDDEDHIASTGIINELLPVDE